MCYLPRKAKRSFCPCRDAFTTRQKNWPPTAGRLISRRTVPPKNLGGFSMTALAFVEPARTADQPAERLRREAAAVRVHFTWWGVHRTLTAQQKEEVGDAY